MKNSVLILILVLFQISCSTSTNKDCTKYKSGTYQYSSRGEEVLSYRTDSTLKEVIQSTKMELYADVEWTSDCNFILTYTDIKHWDTSLDAMIGQKIVCEIIETKEDGFIVHHKGPYSEGPIEMKTVKGSKE